MMKSVAGTGSTLRISPKQESCNTKIKTQNLQLLGGGSV